MKIRPLGSRVLVKRLESQEKVGMFYVPDAHKETQQRAEVVATGQGKRLESGKVLEPAVKKGDVVLLSKYPGGEVKVDGVEYHLVEEEEILAVEENG